MAEILQESQYSDWDDFVRRAKGGTIFHTSWYLLALTDDLRIDVLRDKEGRIEAGMVTMPMRFLGTKAARRPEFTAYNGPLIRESAKKSHVLRVSQEKKLLLQLLAESPAMGMYDYCLPPEHTDLMPYLWNGFDVSLGYTYQVPPCPLAEWHREMTPSHRRDLRKGYQLMKDSSGTVTTTADYEEFCELFRDTAEYKSMSIRAGAPRLRQWWNRLADRDAGRIYLAREANGRSVCATLLLWDHVSGYYVASGIRKEARHGPLNLWSRVLIDRMVQDTHEKGLTFDFEGSTVPGVERFFRGWGGRCVPKYRVVKIRRPWTYAGWHLHRYWTRHRKSKWFTM